jgi:hypothetical protein
VTPDEATELVVVAALNGWSTVRQRFSAEWQDAEKSARWANGSNQVFLALAPLDQSGQVLTFSGSGKLDVEIAEVITMAGWYVQEIARLPGGVAVIASYAGRRWFVRDGAEPVSVIYADRLGGIACDIPTVTLGSARPREENCNRTDLTDRLLMRTAKLVGAGLEVLSAQSYKGRVQAFMWADTGLGFPPNMTRTQGHRGSTILSIGEPWEIRSKKLGEMTSEMTRSWLDFPFSIKEWPEGSMPVYE